MDLRKDIAEVREIVRRERLDLDRAEECDQIAIATRNWKKIETLLWMVYQELSQALIYGNCLWEDGKITCELVHHDSWYSEHDHREMAKKVGGDLIGTKIEIACKGIVIKVEVQMVDTMKTFVCKPEDEGEKYLDFGSLYQTWKERCDLWREQAPRIAEQLMRTVCLPMLCSWPERVLGVEQRTSFTVPYAKLSDEGKIVLGDKVQIKYANLTESELKRLGWLVSDYVSGALVRFDTCKDGLRIEFLRLPDRVVQDAHFDFEKFCQRYDEVTPEMEQELEKICDGLVFVSPRIQLMNLKPRRVLYYPITDKNGPALKDYIARLKLAWVDATLRKVVERRYPGVVVTGITYNMEVQHADYGAMQDKTKDEILSCDKPWNAHAENSIEIHYTLVESEQEVPAIRVQRMVERRIELIKTEYFEQMAEEISARLLKNAVGQQKLGFLIADMRVRLPGDLVRLVLDGESLGRVTIRLDKITDEALMARLNGRIEQLTEGLISYRAGDLSYSVYG